LDLEQVQSVWQRCLNVSKVKANQCLDTSGPHSLWMLG